MNNLIKAGFADTKESKFFSLLCSFFLFYLSNHFLAVFKARKMSESTKRRLQLGAKARQHQKKTDPPQEHVGADRGGFEDE